MDVRISIPPMKGGRVVDETPDFNRIEAAAQSRIIEGWVKRPGSCLDLGGGYGRIVQYVESRFSEVLLVDVSRASLRTARRRLRSACEVQSDISCLPVKDDGFDYVLMTGVVHLLPDPDPVFREILRVAKNHATLILTVPNLQVNHLVRRLTEVYPPIATVIPTFGPPLWPLGTKPYADAQRIIVPRSFHLRARRGTGLMNNYFGKLLSRFLFLHWFEVATSPLWFLKLDVLLRFEVVKDGLKG